MILFENFKQSFSEFKSSLKIWEAITDIEIYKNKCLGWMNLNSADFEGNPILMYYNHEEKRQIRIIQQNKDFIERDFVVYYDYFGDKQSFNGDEIVISAVLTEKNIERYKKVISLWLTNKGIGIEKIEKIK